MLVSEFHIPEDWLRVHHEVIASPGTVFIIGAPDTGKSTFAHFLVYQSMQQGLRTSFIDGDMGQSIVGPPTTLGMALLAKPPDDMEAVRFDRLYFIGATSPAGHLLATAVGVKRLVEKAKEGGASMVVVDTTGLVAGEMGFELKFYKIDVLCPQHIIAFQKTTEIEHILKGFKGRKDTTIHLLAPSKWVRSRSPEVRRAYREKRFREYFQCCVRRQVSLDTVELIYTQLPLLGKEGLDDQFKGILLGLNDEEYFTLGLGILEGVNRGNDELCIITPLNNLVNVRYIHLGYISLSITF
jgi:polynucleotide 5'-hydroxyl-kinase GRC3/NOL9